ncbi:dimethylarginine dimethylaminohydrolase [Planctomonas sp. JC2975]|uniref:dimethylargininase n=1 Tax=Planctomonas sp. JC2975 TaxID=2729626 RepID=UPI001476118B|nr:dimethylargininase [Planctomonas sp. JC2975]NNC11763.1 dimethylarginine dimethylaminohydrolase [Planctomonas sp. JC2975]
MTVAWSRKIVASVLTGFLVALLVHIGTIVLTNEAYLVQGAGWAAILSLSGFFTLASVFTFVLLAVAALFDIFATWWGALITGLVVGVIATALDTMIYFVTNGQKPTISVLWAITGERNLLFILLVTVLTPTFGRWLYRTIVRFDTAAATGRQVALVRVPATNLAEGIVTNIDRVAVDPAKADEQWDAYVAALADNGWETVEVAAAEVLPDSVFVEDTAVILGNRAVIALSGAEQRRGETPGTEATLTDLGLRVDRIQEPGTLDGGDVLRVGTTIYVGRSERTNAEGVRQLRAIAAEEGYTVIAVPIKGALHLKSAVTALPDGTVIGDADLIADPSVFDRFLPVPERAGVAVLVLAPDAVLVAASAPKTAELIADLGYRVVTVDISEFEKLEGCVTCLSILVG